MNRNNSVIIALENEFAGLIGKTIFKRTKDACRGKWRGTYDYGLQFTDGTYCPISNGMTKYKENLKRVIRQIEYFNSHKSELEEWVKKVLEVNSRSVYPMKFVLDRLYMIKDTTDYFGWVVFNYHTELNGVPLVYYQYIETNFKYRCVDFENLEYIKKYISHKEDKGFSLDISSKIITKNNVILTEPEKKIPKEILDARFEYYTNKREHVKAYQFATLATVPEKLVFIMDVGKEEVKFLSFFSGYNKYEVVEHILPKSSIRDFDTVSNNFRSNCVFEELIKAHYVNNL